MDIASWFIGGAQPEAAAPSSSLLKSGYREDIKKAFEEGRGACDAARHMQKADAFVEERQASIFEALGIAGGFGVSQLASIQSRFNNDAEVMQALGALVRGEEAVLDEVELPQAAFAAKQEVVRTMESFQLEMATFAASLPQERQQAFVATLTAAMAQAAQQVPQQENPSMADAQAALAAQLRLVREQLHSEGYALIAAGAGPASADQRGLSAVGGGVSSSALSADEQRRFLQSMQRR